MDTTSKPLSSGVRGRGLEAKHMHIFHGRNRISKVPRYSKSAISVRKIRQVPAEWLAESNTRPILPNIQPSELRKVIRKGSFKAVDERIDDEQNRTPQFYSREASRVVLDRGRYRSKPEPEPEPLWAPIKSTSRAAIVWNECLHSAMEYLSQKNILWTALHLGLLDGKTAVAVLYEGDEVWDRDLVERELRDLYFPEEVFTEILFYKAHVKKGAILGAVDYSQSTICGASIGVRGVSWSSGTVGGYFQSPTGEVYGITCHHVLLPTKERPGSENSESKSPAEKGHPGYLDEVGIHHSAFDPKNGEIEVVQPPCGDHIDTVRAFSTEIRKAEEKLEGLKNKYEGLGVPIPDRLVGSWNHRIADSSRSLAVFKSYNRSFGTLVASSGYKVDPESRNSLDWAVFKILDERSVVNTIPEADNEKRRGAWSSLSEARTEFQGIADPVEDENVVKIGRKTGITFGTVSGVKDGVHLKENRGKTVEWCVVGKNGADFSAAGDSGSLVFNEKFQVVGILTAGCDSVGRITYITPIKLVLQDILAMTGLDLAFWDES
ncbi:hypothetical protein TWF718_007753 [Orbilia javanica]|uniref:Uncharacterized protein n=1 Tax=Orbilia javanica TaxID=47235 RepID=A0AAN8NT14_9PEZI